MKQNDVKSVTAHENAPRGFCNVLTPQHPLEFSTNDETAKAVLAFVRASESMELHWEVKVDKTKNEIVPMGLVAALRKTTAIPQHGRLTLT